jgi:hypothetical protein
MKKTSFIKVLSIFFGVTISISAHSQASRTLADCRTIDDTLQRFACYESLDDSSPVTSRGNTPSIGPKDVAPARPVANLPLVRRPSRDLPETSGSSDSPTFSSRSDTSSSPMDTFGLKKQEAPKSKKRGILGRMVGMIPFVGDEDEEPIEEPTTRPQVTGSVDSFGLKDQERAAEVQTNQDGKQELVDTVASLKQIQHNMWQVTLASGQVWNQMYSDAYNLKVGDVVHVYPTGFGDNFRMSAERINGFIQVKRVR